jgi:hypothetical protein
MAQTTERMLTLREAARAGAEKLAFRRKLLEGGLLKSRQAADAVCEAQFEIRSADASLRAVRAVLGEGDDLLGESSRTIMTIMEGLHEQIGPLADAAGRIDALHGPTCEVLEGVQAYSLGMVVSALSPALAKLRARPDFGAFMPASFAKPGQREPAEPDDRSVAIAMAADEATLETGIDETLMPFSGSAAMLDAALEHLDSAQRHVSAASEMMQEAAGIYGRAHGSIEGRAGSETSPGINATKDALGVVIRDAGEEAATLDTLASGIETLIATATTGISAVIGNMGRFVTGAFAEAAGAAPAVRMEQVPAMDAETAVRDALAGKMDGVRALAGEGREGALATTLFDAAIAASGTERLAEAKNAVSALLVIGQMKPEAGAGGLIHRVSTEHADAEVRSFATQAAIILATPDHQ